MKTEGPRWERGPGRNDDGSIRCPSHTGPVHRCQSCARDIARALGGKDRHDGKGNYACSCPLPTHGRGKGDRRHSLSLRDGDKGLLVKCWGGCDRLDVLAELKRRGYIDGAFTRPSPWSVTPKLDTPKSDKGEYARKLWSGAQPITGTVAEAYLRGRGITIELPPSLRWHPCVKVPGKPVHFSAMIAGLSGDDRAVNSVQVTWLDARSATKAPLDNPRRTYGTMNGCAVRLGAAGVDLGLAEGVETALSVMQLFDMPVWASLGKERLCKIELPSVRRVHLFPDPDAVMHTQIEARRYLDRHHILFHEPPDIGDWNDWLRRAK